MAQFHSQVYTQRTAYPTTVIFVLPCLLLLYTIARKWIQIYSIYTLSVFLGQTIQQTNTPIL